MGTMYFPGEEPDNVEKLYTRDGHFVKRYKSERGPGLTEHHYRQGEDSPLMWADYWSDYQDKTNRETVFFEGSTGKEKPYLRRVYRQNRLMKEERLGKNLTVLSREEYEYRDGETMPRSIRREDFDEKGNSLSVMVRDKENPFGKILTSSKKEKSSNQTGLLEKGSKEGDPNRMSMLRSGKVNQKINERSIR